MARVLYLAAGISLVLALNNAQLKARHISQQSSALKDYRSPFRYVIIRNDVIDIVGDPKEARRFVEILLDEKAFSAEILKDVFKLISARFPSPQRFDVWVYTNLEQVKTPEESEMGNLSESDKLPVPDNHHKALLVRSESDEWIRYTLRPPSTDMKTVVLKGKTRN